MYVIKSGALLSSEEDEWLSIDMKNFMMKKVAMKYSTSIPFTKNGNMNHGIKYFYSRMKIGGSYTIFILRKSF